METARIGDWLRQRALPLWAEAGVDHQYGGFIECLTLDGTSVVDVPKRLRVQARQIYVFAHAHLLGWKGPWLDVARQGFGFMTQHYWHANGGWVFTAERDGTPSDTVREAYEQAFALFALAWLYGASGDSVALDWATRTLAFMDEQLADPENGGFREAIPDKQPRRQNPHMHLLEALLSLYWATGDGQYVKRAKHLLKLFRERFFDSDTGTLGEFFAHDWRPAPGPTGALVEPGHHFEWVWLLQQYGRITHEDISAEQAALYKFAESHGVDRNDGLAFDGVLRDGSTHDDNKRLWVQTEALKAQIVRIEQGDDAASARLEQLLECLVRRYLLDNGAWQDHVRRDGTGFASHAPASTLYHVFLALSEVLRLSEGRRLSPYPSNSPRSN